MLRATASGLALDAGMSQDVKTLADGGLQVTQRAGKKGHAYRRIIGYKRTGPFHREVGIKWVSGESWPVMQTYFKHAFLHATKGWRTYESGATLRLPASLPQRRPNLSRFPFPEWNAHKSRRGTDGKRLPALLGWRVIPEEAVAA